MVASKSFGRAFKVFKRGDCPICHGAKSGCKSLSDELVLCRDFGANPGSDWIYRKETKDGVWGIWARGEGEDRRDSRPTYTPKEPSAPAVAAWPVADRDRAYRAMAGALALAHRVEILKRPLVTKAEVDALVNAGVLLTWKGGQTVAGAGVGLPGVRPDGRLAAWHTWAVAALDLQGRIIGIQYRNDRNPDEGKYKWASGWGGATPHIDGELPITVLGTPKDGVAELAEGIGLKPGLGWQRYDGLWFGASGANFASSQKQLRAALEFHKITQVILNPDGGAIANHGVMTQYRKVATLLEGWGIPLSVRWWGQATKAHGDVDEIAPEVFQNSQVMPWAEFEAMAPKPKQQRRQRERAKDTKSLKRKQTVKQAMAIFRASIPDAGISTEGGFINFPENWEYLAVDAGMGAGKTTAMIDAIKAWWHSIRGYSLVLSSRISLGQQTAIKGDIPHSGDIGIGGEADKLLGALARQRGGLVTQVNSLPRLAHEIPKDSLMLLLDEAMATLSEAAKGGTLGRQKFSLAWEILFTLMRSSKRILLSEANLNAATINLVQEITGRKISLIRHKTDGARFPLNLVSTSSGWWDMLLDALAIHPLRDYPPADQMPNGHQRVLVMTTSKAQADQLELIAIEAGIPPEKILKVTGDTNEAGAFGGLWEDPDAFLSTHKPRLAIFTQTAQTGLSIEGDHFDAVFGYGPGFRASVIWQMLGRYRVPVPRFVWVPPFIQPERHEKPTREQSGAAANRDVSRWCGHGFKPVADGDQAALDRYIAENNAQAWAEKVAPREVLSMMAERGGHAVATIQHPLEKEVFEVIQALRDGAKDTLAQRHSRQHARAKLDPAIHTADWAREARQRETTYTERVLLRKYDSLQTFPGIDWDSPEIWYEGVFRPRQHEDGEVILGPLAPGARLWAECGAADLLEALDRNEAGLVFARRFVAASILPTHSVKVGILAPMVPLCEELLIKGQASPGCPIVKRLAAMARAVDQDLSDYLRITATDDQSDVAIANKILRKFAITVTRQNQCTTAGKRVWIYSVEVPELWSALVEARRESLEALKEGRLGACTKFVEGASNKFGAGGSVEPPPDPTKPTHRWVFMGLNGWLDRVEDGAKAIFRTIAGTIYTLSVSDLEALA